MQTKRQFAQVSTREVEQIARMPSGDYRNKFSDNNKNLIQENDTCTVEEGRKKKKPQANTISKCNMIHEEDEDFESKEVEGNKKKTRENKILKTRKAVEEENDDSLLEEEKNRKRIPTSPRDCNKGRKKNAIEEDGNCEDVEEREVVEDEKLKGTEEEEAQARPIGNPIKVFGTGKDKKIHYSSFVYEGDTYMLEDPVLLTPASEDEKPYVAIIRDITESGNGLMVTGQWFYSPQEVVIREGGTWQPHDTRELFYSFHLNDVPAESVMHKCVVHFVPLNKKLPLRSKNPGFIVQKVYDMIEKRLWNLMDNNYEDCKQEEINQMVKKTIDRNGELPDIENENVGPMSHNNELVGECLRTKGLAPIGTKRVNEFGVKSEKATKPVPVTPASFPSDASEYYEILTKFKALTGDSIRDMWSERILQGIQPACVSINNGSEENGADLQDGEKFIWPDSAVEATIALQKASHESLSSEFQKYDQKMRQLVYNIKNNVVLARRLLNKELDPAVILNMSPNELKDGQIADERINKEPKESEGMQHFGQNMRLLLAKELTNSDVSLGRIGLPKGQAEAHLPVLKVREGLKLTMSDMEFPRVWTFKYRCWPSGKSIMYALDNTGNFVKAHNLQLGDIVMLYKDDQQDRYIICARSKVRAQQEEMFDH